MGIEGPEQKPTDRLREALDGLGNAIFKDATKKPVVNINNVRKAAPRRRLESRQPGPPKQETEPLSKRYFDAGAVSRRFTPKEDD